MRRFTTSLALAAALGGCASAVGAPERQEVAAGGAFAHRACAGCHAIGRTGESPNPHSPPFRALAAQLPGPALEAQLGSIAERGHVEMPPIYMTPEELRQVAAYIRSVAGPGRGRRENA
jgi:mono/diheme cytochrome c family protein